MYEGGGASHSTPSKPLRIAQFSWADSCGKSWQRESLLLWIWSIASISFGHKTFRFVRSVTWFSLVFSFKFIQPSYNLVFDFVWIKIWWFQSGLLAEELLIIVNCSWRVAIFWDQAWSNVFGYCLEKPFGLERDTDWYLYGGTIGSTSVLRFLVDFSENRSSGFSSLQNTKL